jgi:hypothetical protein
MKALKIYEKLGFERGMDPKKSMNIGLEQKYGRMYNLFVICHNLAMNSEAFEWVSDIVLKEEKPYFNIESLFYYTDEENNKIPERFIITLFEESLFIVNEITKEEYNIKSAKRFMEITSAYEGEEARELADHLKDY